MAKLQHGPQMALRLTKEENDVLGMYAKALNKPKARIVHEFIKENFVHMLLVCNRYEAEEEAKAPGAADWTPTLPDRENKQ